MPVKPSPARRCNLTGVTENKLTDVVDGPGTELPAELFGPKAPQVVDSEGPQVKHIVPGEGVSLLQQHHSSTHEAQLNCRPQTARTRPNDHTLTNQERGVTVMSSDNKRRAQIKYLQVALMEIITKFSFSNLEYK